MSYNSLAWVLPTAVVNSKYMHVYSYNAICNMRNPNCYRHSALPLVLVYCPNQLAESLQPFIFSLCLFHDVLRDAVPSSYGWMPKGCVHDLSHGANSWDH